LRPRSRRRDTFRHRYGIAPGPGNSGGRGEGGGAGVAAPPLGAGLGGRYGPLGSGAPASDSENAPPAFGCELALVEDDVDLGPENEKGLRYRVAKRSAGCIANNIAREDVDALPLGREMRRRFFPCLRRAI